MGYDLYGQKPKNEKGEYFRNNIWWWRRIWVFVVTHCDFLTDKEKMAGNDNGGRKIVIPKAEKIAKRLRALIEDGTAAAYEKEIKTLIKSEAKKNKVKKGQFHTKNWDANYPFTVENLKEFITFVENSGGFRIY
jgi:hypothetical protein